MKCGFRYGSGRAGRVRMQGFCQPTSEPSRKTAAAWPRTESAINCRSSPPAFGPSHLGRCRATWVRGNLRHTRDSRRRYEVLAGAFQRHEGSARAANARFAERAQPRRVSGPRRLLVPADRHRRRTLLAAGALAQGVPSRRQRPVTHICGERNERGVRRHCSTRVRRSRRSMLAPYVILDRSRATRYPDQVCGFLESARTRHEHCGHGR